MVGGRGGRRWARRGLLRGGGETGRRLCGGKPVGRGCLLIEIVTWSDLTWPGLTWPDLTFLVVGGDAMRQGGGWG